MVPVYAVALIAGVLLLVVWIVGVAIGAWVEGWEFGDPERRLGAKGRFAVAGVVGLGMAGMSALFGGWPPALACVGAEAGGIGMIVVTRVFGPDTA